MTILLQVTLVLCLIILTSSLNPNEDNLLGKERLNQEQLLDLNGHDEDDTHDVHDVSNTTMTAPVFVNMKKMHKNIIKPAGNMATLKCKASGYPAPNITWFKNDKLPERNLGDIRYNTWSLVLEDLVTSDAGDYKCVVCNIIDCINFTYVVEVVGKLTKEDQSGL